jgi:hypothetical protein
MLSYGFDYSATDFKNLTAHTDPSKLLQALKNHRLYPSFYKRWKNIHTDSLPSSQWQQFSSSLKQITEYNRLQMLQKATTLLKIIAAFKKNQIPTITLKGPALAQQLYGDVAMKASLDLDILIPQSYFSTAAETLKSIGFIADVPYSLTPRQELYLLNNFHHYAFTNGSTSVEMHWQLNTNKYMAARPIDEYFHNPSYCKIAGTQVPVLNSSQLIEYLAIHGSYHAWARLDWLYDFSTVLLQNNNHLNDAIQSAQQCGLKTVLNQSVSLSHILFATPLPMSPVSVKPSLLSVPIKHISQPYKSSKKQGLSRISQKIYLLRLKNGWNYRIHIFSALGTNQEDWKDLQLPDKLFPLYFLLRPFLYIKRFIRNR